MARAFRSPAPVPSPGPVGGQKKEQPTLTTDLSYRRPIDLPYIHSSRRLSHPSPTTRSHCTGSGKRPRLADDEVVDAAPGEPCTAKQPCDHLRLRAGSEGLLLASLPRRTRRPRPSPPPPPAAHPQPGPPQHALPASAGSPAAVLSPPGPATSAPTCCSTPPTSSTRASSSAHQPPLLQPLRPGPTPTRHPISHQTNAHPPPGPRRQSHRIARDKQPGAQQRRRQQQEQQPPPSPARRLPSSPRMPPTLSPASPPPSPPTRRAANSPPCSLSPNHD